MPSPLAFGATLSAAALGLLTLAASCGSQPEGATPVPAGEAAPPPATAPRRPLLADGLPAGMMRHRAPGTLKIDSPTCASPHLTYYGGPLLQSPVIVPVYWNADVNPAIVANKPQFYADITRSAYWKLLAEYDSVGLTPGTNQAILPGTATAGVVLQPLVCPASTSTTTCDMTDTDLTSEIARQIGLGVLPAPTLDCTGNVQTIYMVDFPPYVALTGPDGSGYSCKQFCAYHNTATYGPNSVPLVYAALMDMFTGPCASGCGQSTAPLDNATETASHELAEATTDTDIGLIPITTPGFVAPGAWYDETNNCGEIGDICDGKGNDASITVSGRTWMVQELWSNLQNNCVSAGVPQPICSGTTLTGCRPCSCGDDGTACTGATPVCETDSTNVLFGACEQCTAKSGTCATCQQSSTPAQDDVCVGCTPIAACPSGGDCGTVSNGCGGTYPCGTCVAPQTCGGGSPSNPNLCGCVPTATACPAGDDCGTVPDGCGNQIPCGTCTAPQTCGGGTPSNPNVCGCTPNVDACPAGGNCGTASDGCGGMVPCGSAPCTAPETCGGGTPSMLNVCGCTPLTACPTTVDCGNVPDGCGGTLPCGGCTSPQICTNFQCVTMSTTSSGAGTGGEGTGGSGSSSTGSDTGGGGSSTGAAAAKSGCSCRAAGDPAGTPGPLSALGVLALAGVVRARRRRG